MCVLNLVPIGPQTATCIRLEGYTHRHTLSYIDIDRYRYTVYTRIIWSRRFAFKSRGFILTLNQLRISQGGTHLC